MSLFRHTRIGNAQKMHLSHLNSTKLINAVDFINDALIYGAVAKIGFSSDRKKMQSLEEDCGINNRQVPFQGCRDIFANSF